MERTLDAGSASLANSARKMAQLQAGPGLRRVPMHLLDQRLERVETYLVAQAGDEIDVEVAAGEGATGVEQRSTAERRRCKTDSAAASGGSPPPIVGRVPRLATAGSDVKSGPSTRTAKMPQSGIT